MSMFNNIYYFNADICVCHLKKLREQHVSSFEKWTHYYKL